MASSSSSPTSSNINQAHAHLRSMFPNVDPAYLYSAVGSYPSTSSFTSDKLISKVASKMLDMNHGYWPTVLLRDMTRIAHTTSNNGNTGTSPWSNLSNRKGKGRNTNSLNMSGSSNTLLQVDQVASRNVALITLNDMFPEVDLAHLRHSLLEADHSYLYTALSSLLSDSTLSMDSKSQWQTHEDKALHQGRSSSRRQHEPLPKRQSPGEITYADLIKDDTYAEGAFQMICAQFPNIWKSSIKAIMAEHNNDYFTSVDAVKRVQDEKPINFFAKTWAALTSALSSKPSPSSMPNTGDDFSLPTYLSTTPNIASLSPMLLHELQLHLSATLPELPSTSTKSRKGKEVEGANSEEMECGCCFGDMDVGRAMACADGCLFCMDCLGRTVQESVFGQAPLRLYRDASPTDSSTTKAPGGGRGGGEGTGIRCLSIEGCQASFSDKELKRCLSTELYTSLQTRLAQQNLQLYQASMRRAEGKKEIRTVQCPFCPYMEVEDVLGLSALWSTSGSVLEVLKSLASFFSLGVLYLLWSMGAIFFPDLLNTPSQAKNTNKHLNTSAREDEDKIPHPIYFALQPLSGLKDITNRIRQIFDVCATKHGSTVFRCKNVSTEQRRTSSSIFASPALVYGLLPPPPPSSLSSNSSSSTPSTSATCGRPSCRLCLKLHYSGHECLDTTEGLRLAQEQAASNAIKRQCPECGLSFVKDNGCNKIVCRCGYSMCFVCRKGIGMERYAHFCQHVRDPGMPCTECTKCDLFKEEDEMLAVRKAVKKAEKQWLQEHTEFDQRRKGDVPINDDTSLTPSVLEYLEQITQSTIETLLHWR